MAYNPYGEGNEYKHSFALKNLDVSGQVLMGKKYWEYMGENDTCDELLRIFRKVGKDVGRKSIENAIKGKSMKNVEKPNRTITPKSD